MRKIVRKAFVAVNLATIGFSALAYDTLPRSSTSGPSSCGNYCSKYDGYSDEGEGDTPEADGGTSSSPYVVTKAPPTKKKTPAQKAAAVEVCKEKKTQYRADTTTIYQANMAVCAAGSQSWYGYLQEQWMKVGAKVVLGGGLPQDCASVNTRAFQDSMDIIDRRYDECVAEANKD